MAHLNASEVAELLAEIGERLELAGESRFKFKAYSRGAQALLSLPIPLEDVIAQGRLRELPGIGKVLSAKIETMHRTGTHPTLEKLRNQYPSGLLEMLKVPRLRREKVIQLYQQLGISNLDELEEACRTGELAGAKGFGPAFQEKTQRSIEFARHYGCALHLLNSDHRLQDEVRFIKYLFEYFLVSLDLPPDAS